MTQNKNKKGIAKKALSISLVAAMLATSNVPVWASFEAVDDVTGFVLEEATPDVEVAPAAEDTDALAVTDSETGYTANIELNAPENGWADSITVKNASITDDNGNPVTNYKWTIRKDGYAVKSEWTDQTSPITTNSSTWYIPLEHDDYGHVYDVVVEISLANDKTVKFFSNKITVGAVNINKIAPNAKLEFDTTTLGVNHYTGDTIKLTVSNTGYIIDSGNIQLAKGDFAYTYSGDLVNVTDDGVTVTGVVAKEDKTTPDPAYTGSISGNYKIAPRALDVTNLSSVEAKLVKDGQEFPFTGEAIKFLPNDVIVSVTDGNVTNEAVKNISYAVSKVEGKMGGEKLKAKITLDAEKLAPNFTLSKGNIINTSNTYDVVREDLNTCKAVLKRSYSKAELRKAGFSLKEEDFVFTNGKGEVIKPRPDDLKITLDSSKIKVGQENAAGTYTNAVIIESTEQGFKADGKIYADLTIVDNGLGNGTFANEVNFKSSLPFAGKGVAVEQDIKALGNFSVDGLTLNASGNKDYEIVYEDNTSAGTAKMIVKGLGIYAGTEKVYEYKITPAPILTATFDKSEVTYNEDYTYAADYLKDIVLTVKADNLSTTKVTTDRFILDEDDYVISNLKDLQAKRVKEGDTFTIKVEGLKNAKGEWSGNYFGSVDATDAKNPSKVTITICKKSLSSEDIKVTVKPDTYVYTGSAIVPKEVIVTDGSTILEEGVDYVVKSQVLSSDAVNVGTAKITVVAPQNSRYKADSEATGTFTITPAKTEDVVVKYADATYDGTKHSDKTKVKLMLGEVDVTKDFDISFPVSKNANINAGKDAGKITLTATAAKAKNYTAKTKDATFEIKPAELTGTIELYDSVGRPLSNIKTFAYDGTAHTYEDVKFVPDGPLASKVTANDYEIVYADNVYGKEWQGVRYGHVFVVAKGNFTGVADKNVNNEFDADGTYTTDAGEKITSIAAGNLLIITQAEIKPEDITVSNGIYASGYAVKPNVTVKVHGKTLVEGKDYTLDVSMNKDIVNVTSAKTLKVVVKPINGYKMAAGKSEVNYTFNWEIDKFDLKDATITVSGEKVTVMNGDVVVPANEYNVTFNEDGTITIKATEGNKNYTGEKTISGVKAPEATTLRVTDRTTSTVSLAWDEVKGAEGYTIWFRSEYDTKVSRKIIQGGDVTSWTQNGLQPGTKYFYTIRAWVKDNEGKYVFGEQSPVQRGTTKPIAAQIKSVSATNGKVKVVLAGKAAGAEMYSMCYSKSADFDNFAVGIRTSYTTRTFSKTLAKGTYFVRVKSYRDLGNNKRVYGAWSNTMTVVVK